METFQNRLIQAMNLRRIKASELAKRTGLSNARISQYVNGVYEAKQTALYKLALTLNVSEGWLMGYDIEMERIHNPVASSDTILENIQLFYGKEVKDMFDLFLQLNFEGKKRVLEITKDFITIDKYKQ